MTESRGLSIKVYIAGAISGLEVEDVKVKFENAEREVVEMFGSHSPVLTNPFALCDGRYDKSWEKESIWKYCMKICIRELLTCDYIYMLRGWENSRGAKLEHKIARSLGLNILYQKERGK